MNQSNPTSQLNQSTHIKLNVVEDPWSEGERLRIHGNEDNDHTSTFAFPVNQKALQLKKGTKLKFGEFVIDFFVKTKFSIKFNQFICTISLTNNNFEIKGTVEVNLIIF